MIGLFRIARAFIGFLILLQIFGIAINLLWLLPKPDVANEYGIASLLYRSVLLLFSCGLFFGIRRVINRLYLNRHGVPHPALAKKRWAL